MRVAIHIDSATTQQVRQLTVALHKAGHTSELKVGCDGPDCWNATTPKLTEVEFAIVRAEAGWADLR